MDTTHVAAEHGWGVQMWGAFCFGLLIGWFLYYINRWRKADVQLTDLVTLIGAIGGAAILQLFKQGSDLFGAYGIGLAVGFFAYFVFLILLVWASPDFKFHWFLDGRRKPPHDGEAFPQPGEPRPTPMLVPGGVVNE